MNRTYFVPVFVAVRKIHVITPVKIIRWLSIQESKDRFPQPGKGKATRH